MQAFPLPISSTTQYSLWGKEVIKAFQIIFSKGIFLFSYYLFKSESLGEKPKRWKKSFLPRKLLKMMSWNQTGFGIEKSLQMRKYTLSKRPNIQSLSTSGNTSDHLAWRFYHFSPLMWCYSSFLRLLCSLKKVIRVANNRSKSQINFQYYHIVASG